MNNYWWLSEFHRQGISLTVFFSMISIKTNKILNLLHHSTKLWFLDVVEEQAADGSIEKVPNTVHNLCDGIQVFGFA